jgi:ureidoacrylate peracid hydrolase
MKMITVSAKPMPIEISIINTAVIVVDMQNDFGSKDGMFDRAGFDISKIRKVVGPTAEVLASARKAGIKIIYLKMGFHPDLSDLGKEGAPNRIGHLQIGVGKEMTSPSGSKSRILVRDTWNTEILSELSPAPQDVIVYKHRYSGFYETELDEVLKKAGIKNLIFASICL